MEAEVQAICVGQPAPFKDGELSAIGKRPLDATAEIRALGIVGDKQADTKHHGGPDMAVHQYPLDHYDWWAQRLNGHELLAHQPAFGENLVVAGMTETDIHIGDRFRLGSALLEVSQPRQPCWKIEHRFQRKGMVKAIIQNHRCGWYYRVIEEGEAQAGDTLQRIATGHTDWSVARVFAKLFDPKDKAGTEELREMASLDQLTASWRKNIAEKLGD